MEFVKKHTKAWVFIALSIGIAVLNGVYGWTDAISKPENLPALQEALREDLIMALLIYCAVTIAGCVVLALPGVVFAIAAGVLFGPLWGTVACSFSATLGACLAFLAGRYFLKDTIKPFVTKNRHIRRLFFEESGKSDLFLLMITRLIPVFPYNLQNFAYGITDIRFGPYALYSFAFMLPGTAAYVIAASGITNDQNRVLYIAVAAALLLAVTGVSLMLKKLQARR